MVVELILSCLASALANKKKGVSGIGYVAAQRPFWYNIPGIQFIYHGEWSDAELYYRGQFYDAEEAEESLYSDYKYEVENEGVSIPFEKWMRKNASEVKATLQNMSPSEFDDSGDESYWHL